MKLVTFLHEYRITHHHLLLQHTIQLGIAHYFIRYHYLVVLFLLPLEHVLLHVFATESFACLTQETKSKLLLTRKWTRVV